MELFSTSTGYCKGYDQKTKNEDKWRVDTEQQQRNTAEEHESQPLINLGLGIGGSNFCVLNLNNKEKDNNFDRIMKVEMKQEKHDDHDHDVDQMVEKIGCRKCSVVRFTEEQVEELKRQLLIFKYMIWGLPVPFQLLLPIWRSFSSSSVPPHLYLYSRSSPFLLAYIRGGFNHHQQTMDPEPGRCRRTDGKKWRCHQSAIPNQKYCEKHMHRGSKRSRKLVEASPYSRAPYLINVNRTTNHPTKDIRPKFPESLVQNRPMAKGVLRAHGLTNTTAKNKNSKQNDEVKPDIVANQRIAVINRASGLDFSPKSAENCKNSPELSESRCKRTDGKKWQCKKEVIPEHKYCAQHINRGKTRSEKLNSGLSTSGSTAQAAAHGSSSSARFSGTGQPMGLSMGPDTNLKISLPTSSAHYPLNTVKDDSMAHNGSCSTSTSTEATVSDESIGVSDIV
ncbi:Growth-regulating factor 10, partial [Bienertia sinuspersici]